MFVNGTAVQKRNLGKRTGIKRLKHKYLYSRK